MKPEVLPRPRPQQQPEAQGGGPRDPPPPVRPRPRSQHNPLGPEGGASPSALAEGVHPHPVPARRSVDFSLLSDLSDSGVGEETRTRTAERPTEATPGGGRRKAGGDGNARTPGSNPTPAARSSANNLKQERSANGPSARNSDTNTSTNVSNSASQDPGNIRRYLTRPWNSDQQPGIQRTSDPWANGQPRGLDGQGHPTVPRTGTPRTTPRSVPDPPPRDPETNLTSQSRASSLASALTIDNDTVDLVRTHSTSSRRPRSQADVDLDADVDSMDAAELTAVAKRKFLTGSYIILFIGILLAVSGAVLTVLAFHNHFGHISIGQQWSLAGIVLMTIGICLLLTYTVTAAKNKYWAIQEDIQLEDRSVGGRESGAGGNYTRNLEQSAGGYMYREVPQRESPNAGQYTETSSVEVEEEQRQAASPAHRLNYGVRYDVAGHEVDTTSPPGRGGTAAAAGYRGRSLRPAPGAPTATGPSHAPSQHPASAQLSGPTHHASSTQPNGPPVSTKRPQPGAPSRGLQTQPGEPVEPVWSRNPPAERQEVGADRPTGADGITNQTVKPTRTAPRAPQHPNQHPSDPMVPPPTRAAPRGPGIEDISRANQHQPQMVSQGVSDSTPANSTSKRNHGVPDLICAVPEGQGPASGSSQEQVRNARTPRKPGPPRKVRLEDFEPRSETVVPLEIMSTKVGRSKGPNRPEAPLFVDSGSRDRRTNDTESGAPNTPKQTSASKNKGKGKDSKKNKGKQSENKREKEQSESGKIKPSRPAPEAPKESTSTRNEGTGKKISAKDKNNTPTAVARSNNSRELTGAQRQGFCCVEAADDRQCRCVPGQGGPLHSEGAVGGLVGPCTGSSDEEGALVPPRPPNTNSRVPRGSEASYPCPPEDGAPPKYQDIRR